MRLLVVMQVLLASPPLCAASSTSSGSSTGTHTPLPPSSEVGWSASYFVLCSLSAALLQHPSFGVGLVIHELMCLCCSVTFTGVVGACADVAVWFCRRRRWV